MSTGKKIINLLFAPLIVTAAVVFIILMVKSRKTPPPRLPVIAVPAVEITESAPADVVPVISTFGNVRAFYQSEIAGQVGGRIEEISSAFNVGRAVNEGDLLARIEEADFKTALAERESSLASINQTLADEETRTLIAREDWIASGRKLEDAPEYTLRKPQLTAAKAALQAAEATVTQSLLDIQRAAIRAPFDAIVETRTASPGNVVAAGTSIGSLIARDKAEVRLPLSPEQAGRLDLPLAFVSTVAKPIKATLCDPNRPSLTWQASVTRTEVGVDQKNQVLYVIAEISKPFDNPQTFLPVGTFVTAELPGRKLENVFRIGDAALMDDAYVWIVDEDNTLRRQPVERVFSGEGDFLARIESPVVPPPLRVVNRPLASFREGGSVTIATVPEP